MVKRSGGMETRVDVLDDPRDHPQDRVLCAEIGKILTDAYPVWRWWVEVPPNQNVVLIRNLDLVQAGTNKPWCMMKYKDRLSASNLRVDILLAAGELLERYERYRGHAGRFQPRDVADKLLIVPQT